MNTQFIRSFAILFAAVIALICAIYVYIGSRKTQKAFQEKQLENN